MPTMPPVAISRIKPRSTQVRRRSRPGTMPCGRSPRRDSRSRKRASRAACSPSKSRRSPWTGRGRSSGVMPTESSRAHAVRALPQRGIRARQGPLLLPAPRRGRRSSCCSVSRIATVALSPELGLDALSEIVRCGGLRRRGARASFRIGGGASVVSGNCPSRTRRRQRPVTRGCGWMLKGSAPCG
jgi:hypothetical protein